VAQNTAEEQNSCAPPLRRKELSRRIKQLRAARCASGFYAPELRCAIENRRRKIGALHECAHAGKSPKRPQKISQER